MINFGYNFILFFNNFCSVSREQEYCTNYHQCGARYQVCPQVPNSTRKHTECYYGSTIGRFNCLNRMEKQHPGIFNQRIYKVGDKFLLNRDLNFIDTGVICNGEKFFPWNSLYGGRADDVCISKNDPGRSILWAKLFQLIVKDFGFQGRNYIPTSLIKE